ncbi:ABC transporter permease [Chloroflexi bacterium TSY]|nr:ABC transporter permease [Chloroflexi bacterium TSY]
MIQYILRRLLFAIPVILGVSILVFSMLHLLPGDPAELMLGEMGNTPENIEQMRESLGLNDPLYVQYGRYLWGALQGDLGESIRTRKAVSWYIGRQIMSTVQLTVAGIGTAVIIGMALGMLAAVRQNSWLDNVSMFVALFGISVPNFWLGLLLIFVFSIWLGWVPVTGQGGLQGLILPAVALALPSMAVVARLTRSSMLEVLRQEYVTVAHAKGLNSRVVILRHVLKNALIPVITIVGLQFGSLLGGAVTIEIVFGRQGLGRILVDSVLAQDYPMVQGCVLLAAVVYVFVNLLVDVTYVWIDPRIRFE